MNINTWQQGYFVDQRRYSGWTKEEKEKADRDERLKVRPSPTGNAICFCSNPEDAKWIAERLNMAANLEEMTYNFTTGKSDGSDIVDYVRKAIDRI
ncbi:MAG: hypothetical protein CVV44_03960 [Spirochaetae bacterium HGW-Spirochaetae-1]|jgi:hypothetical protein|nr:MAG: hypothetical protein CVV44_03960 [Spirochaetae bacterium HGW-Spirochaetae-1]